MSAPDNPPAFPRPGIPSNWAEGHHAHVGMTLRDYFAGQALAGSLANSRCGGEPDEFARDAYLYADAMLAAREAKP